MFNFILYNIKILQKTAFYIKFSKCVNQLFFFKFFLFTLLFLVRRNCLFFFLFPYLLICLLDVECYFSFNVFMDVTNSDYSLAEGEQLVLNIRVSGSQERTCE